MLISPTKLTHMLDNVTAAQQKANPDYTLLFPDLYYYYDIKLVIIGYNKDVTCYFGLQSSVNYRPQKPLALYQA